MGEYMNEFKFWGVLPTTVPFSDVLYAAKYYGVNVLEVDLLEKLDGSTDYSVIVGSDCESCRDEFESNFDDLADFY